MRRFLLPVGVYLFLSLLYLFAIPVGESPDEPGHLQCIEQVALFNRLPVMEPRPEGDVWWAHGRIVAGHMCYHMPLYYVVSGTILREVATATQTSMTYEFPPTNARFGPETAMFVHDKNAFWQLAEPITLTALRIFSICLGLALIWAAYHLTTRLAPEWPLFAVFAAVVVAGWPQIAYLSRAIANDALATALAVLTLAVAAEVGKPKRFVLLAVLSSLALLSKVTMAFVVVVVFLVLLLEIRQFREQRVVYGSVAAVCMGVWLGTAVLLYFHPLLHEHLAISNRAFATVPAAVTTFAYWQDVFIYTLSSGWARLAWMNLPAPLAHAYLWWAVLAAATTGGYFIIWRKAETAEQRILLWICLFWAVGLLLTYLRININRLQPQFRFLLPLAPVLAAGAVVGFLYGLRTRPSRQWQLIIGTAVVLVAYNIWFVFTIVQPAYGWQF